MDGDRGHVRQISTSLPPPEGCRYLAHVTFLETQKVENAKETRIFHAIELQEQRNIKQ